MTDAIREALAIGQSIWYDGIHRSLMTSGDLERMVLKEGLRGMTSNPSIFEKAIAGTSDYEEAFAELRRSEPRDARSAYESIAIADIRSAADILRSVYDESDGADGFVSIEVSPELAHDSAATGAEARRLWSAVDRPNLMVKVPATTEGIPVIQELIAAGINVNITLLFGREVYEEVVRAYIGGLEDRLRTGSSLEGVASVASVFVSRLDSAVDPQIEPSLHGKVAIANAKVIYSRFRELFAGPRWQRLADTGAKTQRLLWASTSTKDPAFPELLYVESLMGPDTVDTVPPATYETFRAHGVVRSEIETGMEEAHAILDGLQTRGLDLAKVTNQLLDDGVEKFTDAFRELLSTVEQALARSPEVPAGSGRAQPG